MKTTVYNLAGEKVSEVELNPVLFEVEIKPEVVHQVVVAQERNARKNIAHVKDRSEVKATGRKPWKQKGTGRARAGSAASPLWRGGGKTFGPQKDRNYSVKVNKKMKNLALRMVLSDKAKEDNLIVVDNLELAEQKTKILNETLNKLPLANKKTVIALAKTDPKLTRTTANLIKVLAIGATSLNVTDLLKYQYLLVSQAGLIEIEKFYAKK